MVLLWHDLEFFLLKALNVFVFYKPDQRRRHFVGARLSKFIMNAKINP
jgi:hypothetical protein